MTRVWADLSKQEIKIFVGAFDDLGIKQKTAGEKNDADSVSGLWQQTGGFEEWSRRSLRTSVYLNWDPICPGVTYEQPRKANF